MAERSALFDGLVVASHGRHCLVESPDGARRICHPRGKKSQAVVGDRVLWQLPAPGQGDEGTIERVQERRNLFYRQDEIRTKSFAANLDQIALVERDDRPDLLGLGGDQCPRMGAPAGVPAHAGRAARRGRCRRRA